MPVEYVKSGHLVTITLNRPAKLNAIDAPMQAALAAAWTRYEQDEDAWLAILSANGRAFSAGADRSWFERIARGEDGLGLFLQGVNRDPYWSGAIDKPTIAAVNGVTIGAGVDLVLRADLRVAAEDATFQLREVDLGGVLVLWDNLPYAITAEMIAGAEFSAQRAHAVGMINRLAPAGGALECARAWAGELLAKPPLALRRALKILRDIRNANAVPSTPELRNLTTDASRRLAASAEWKASVASWLQGVKPQSTGD
jgi:enoyl-CoA hydratase/carnithine racemase